MCVVMWLSHDGHVGHACRFFVSPEGVALADIVSGYDNHFSLIPKVGI